jgi:hypothetical protein
MPAYHHTAINIKNATKALRKKLKYYKMISDGNDYWKKHQEFLDDYTDYGNNWTNSTPWDPSPFNYFADSLSEQGPLFSSAKTTQLFKKLKNALIKTQNLLADISSSSTSASASKLTRKFTTLSNQLAQLFEDEDLSHAETQEKLDDILEIQHAFATPSSRLEDWMRLGGWRVRRKREVKDRKRVEKRRRDDRGMELAVFAAVVVFVAYKVIT